MSVIASLRPLTPEHRSIVDDARAALQRELVTIGSSVVQALDEAVIERAIRDAIVTFNQAAVNRPGRWLFPDEPDGQQLIRDYLTGFGAVSAVLRAPTLEDLNIDGPTNIRAIFGHPRAVSDPPAGEEELPLAFRDNQEIIDTFHYALAAAGAAWDTAHPICHAPLGDNLRFCGFLPPLTDQVVVNIRKQPREALLLTDLRQRGTISGEVETFLRSVVRAGLTVVVAGGTGSGKTTLLNALGLEIRDRVGRIVTIEQQPELMLANPEYRGFLRHATRLIAREGNTDGVGEVTMRDLLVGALRLRPVRIWMGELRDGVAYDWLQACNTGHDGSGTTIHANSGRDALDRLITLGLQAREGLSEASITRMVASAVHLVIHQRYDPLTGRRYINEISEVAGEVQGSRPLLNCLFRWDARRQTQVWTGIRPRCAALLAGRELPLGIDLDRPPPVDTTDEAAW